MLSLHIIADFCPQERLDRALLYLTRVKPPTVNIAGGAQMDRAMQFAQQVRSVLPNIVIQFRILEDTGIVIKLTPDEWWARYVTPRSEWLIANKITLVVDNETSGDDNTIKTYVERETTIAQKLHTIGLGGVFCRFATGNIGESQYALLKPLLDVLGDKDWVGPNEYSNIPGHSASGHLERYKRIEAIVPNKHLNMSIGECGILVDYQARTGYLDAHISGAAMAAQLIGEEMWYRGGTIPRHLYCIGGNQDWKSLQIGDDALEFLEAYYTKNPITPAEPPPVITPPPAPPYTPDPVTAGMRYQITTPGDYVNVRLIPSAIGSKVGEIPNQSVITVTEETLTGGEYWRRVEFGTVTGWVSMQGGAVKLAPYIPDVPSMVSVPIDLLKDIRNSLKHDLDLVNAILDKIGGT